MLKTYSKLIITFTMHTLLLVSALPESMAADFATRCNDPDIVRCWGFDTIGEVSSGLSDAWYNPNGSYIGEDRCENGTCKIVDTTIKSSGGGSLRMEIPSNSYADSSGNWKGNFSDDLSVQFGEGEEFFVQWRQRFSSSMLNTIFANTAGQGGWKTIIIGEGDRPGYNASSCTTLEVVINNYAYKGVPQAYWGCGAGGSFQENYGPYDFKEQNAYDAGENANPRYCLYSTSKTNYTRPMPGCYPFYANEWMTFQVRIKVGDWGQPNSEVDIWVGREGESSVLIISHSGITIHQDVQGASKYGKVWFTPYNTSKDGNHSHPTAYTWYDDLIVSRKRIPDPIDPPRPSAPNNVLAR